MSAHEMDCSPLTKLNICTRRRLAMIPIVALQLAVDGCAVMSIFPALSHGVSSALCRNRFLFSFVIHDVVHPVRAVTYKARVDRNPRPVKSELFLIPNNRLNGNIQPLRHFFSGQEFGWRGHFHLHGLTLERSGGWLHGRTVNPVGMV